MEGIKKNQKDLYNYNSCFWSGVKNQLEQSKHEYIFCYKLGSVRKLRNQILLNSKPPLRTVKYFDPTWKCQDMVRIDMILAMEFLGLIEGGQLRSIRGAIKKK